MFVDYKALIRNLTENQTEVFEEICVGNESNHSLITLSVLVEKGLIKRHVRQVASSNFVIEHYTFANDFVYIAWCELSLEEIKGVKE